MSRIDGRTWTPAGALEALGRTDTNFVTLFQQGTLEVEIYRPVGIDSQKPHTKDELYVVIAGTGTFVHGDARSSFGPGDALFVRAGIVHRFEDFTANFATWVFFYGPEGGE